MIKIKDGEVRPGGCICELNSGYNAKTVVYTNSSSDIPKLYEIARMFGRKKIIMPCALTVVLYLIDIFTDTPSQKRCRHERRKITQ